MYSVLQIFVRNLQKVLLPCFKLYADLPGYLDSVSPPSIYIPLNFSSSLSRPNLVQVLLHYLSSQWLLILNITFRLPTIENKIAMVLCCKTFKTQIIGEIMHATGPD